MPFLRGSLKGGGPKQVDLGSFFKKKTMEEEEKPVVKPEDEKTVGMEVGEASLAAPSSTDAEMAAADTGTAVADALLAALSPPHSNLKTEGEADSADALLAAIPAPQSSPKTEGEADSAAALLAASLGDAHGNMPFLVSSTSDTHMFCAKLPPYVSTSAGVFAMEPSVLWVTSCAEKVSIFVTSRRTYESLHDASLVPPFVSA